MGRKMTKNPNWIQFSDEVWGEAVGGSEYSDFLSSFDAPEPPTSALDPLPDHDAPLRPAWILEHVMELVEDERRRVIGPHGATFARHADMQMAVAHLDASRLAAAGDLRDQLTRQHQQAKQELDDFQRSDGFQKALRHYLEAAGPAFERLAAATPENQAAVVHQQQVMARWNDLRSKIIGNDDGPSQAVECRVASDPLPKVAGDHEPMLSKGRNTRKKVEQWVVWWSREIVKDKTNSTKDRIADEILKKAGRFGYESNNGPLSTEAVVRMIPPGLTGGRGRKPGSQARK